MDGGYAQYVTLKSEAVCWIPEDVDPAETAPLLCAGVTTFSKSSCCNISCPAFDRQLRLSAQHGRQARRDCSRSRNWVSGTFDLASHHDRLHASSGLGHLAIQFARAMGFRTVALSHSDSKKDLAQQLGAMTYIDTSKQNAAEELQKMGGAKVIMCTAPHVDVIEGLISGLTVGGQLLVLAMPEEKASIDLGKACLSETSSFIVFMLTR